MSDKQVFLQQLIALFMLLALSLPLAARQTVGYVENVNIYPGGLHIHAKVDSGASISSLNCDCSKSFQQDGKEWISFRLADNYGKVHTLHRRVVRYARVVQHFGEVQMRPVILLGLCVAGIYRETEVNLVNRKGYKYQMLVGRSFMQDDFLIAPDKKYLTKPHCSPQDD